MAFRRHRRGLGGARAALRAPAAAAAPAGDRMAGERARLPARPAGRVCYERLLVAAAEAVAGTRACARAALRAGYARDARGHRRARARTGTRDRAQAAVLRSRTKTRVTTSHG